MIDWQAFTPISLVGGFIIGIASVLLLLGNGKIAGISGITSYIVKPKQAQTWHLLFVLGLLMSPWLYQIFHQIPTTEVTTSIPLLIISGLMVGFGTRMGSGCTSGHGICGNARFSLRSLVATCVFMLTGMLTVFVVKTVFDSII